MPVFHCKIGTADGRVLDREFEAANREALLENLEEQGFFVFQIRRSAWRGWLEAGSGRLSGRRFLGLNQEMLVLIRSGLPILQVLDTLIERMEAGRLLDVLREIRNDVKGGGRCPMPSAVFRPCSRNFTWPRCGPASSRATCR